MKQKGEDCRGIAGHSCIVKDCQPFNTVEDVGFKTFVSLLDPNYILPSRKALKTMVVTTFKEEEEKAREEIQKATAVSLTSDMSTSIHMDAYLAAFASLWTVRTNWHLLY